MKVMDLTGSLVTSSRPLGWPQKRPDDRTLNAGVAVRTADGSRWTADAGDEQCLRCGCSSRSCTVVLCAADIDGPLDSNKRSENFDERPHHKGCWCFIGKFKVKSAIWEQCSNSKGVQFFMECYITVDFHDRRCLLC